MKPTCLFVFNHPAPYKVDFFNELAKYIDLTVIFERDKASNRESKFYSKTQYLFKKLSINGLCFGDENIISNGIIKHIKKNKYDFIIMNGYSTIAEMKTINYLKKHQIPYYFYINGGIIKAHESSILYSFKRKYISGAKGYFSPDERSNKYLEHYGANPKRIFNYPYATIFDHEINGSKLSSADKRLMRENHGYECDYLFVTCGQIIERKNIFGLIKEWKNQPSSHLLLIIGSGKDQKKCEHYIKKNGLTNVRIIGFLPKEEILKIYRYADAFIFASREDIYGHVINEALSQGLPVISTPNVNASLHLIKNGENGYIVPNIEGQEFKQALIEILNKEFYNGCIDVAKMNTIEKMTQKHIEILNMEAKQ